MMKRLYLPILWTLFMAGITAYDFARYGWRDDSPWIDVGIVVFVLPFLIWLRLTHRSKTIIRDGFEIKIEGRNSDVDHFADKLTDILRKGHEPVETPHEDDL